MRASSVLRCPIALLAPAVLATAAGPCLAFGPYSRGATALSPLTLAPVLLAGAAASVWAVRQALFREWLLPRWGDFTRGLFGAALLYFFAWAFSRAVAPIGSAREVWLVSLYAHIGDPRALRSCAAATAAAVVGAAFAEEMLWRGMVTQLLAERVGSRAAWRWAAALYALSYVPSAFVSGGAAGPNPLLFLAAACGGLLWGAMARAFGRLAPGILSHALFDWAVVMAFPLWGPYHRL